MKGYLSAVLFFFCICSDPLFVKCNEPASVNITAVLQHLTEIIEENGGELSKSFSNLVETVSLQREEINRLSSKVDNMSKLLYSLLDVVAEQEAVPGTHSLSSCEKIKAFMPASTSGYYNITDSSGQNHHVYCKMEEMCGSDSGWTRVAFLNMSDPQAECPNGFRRYERNGVRACGRPVSPSGSCVSTTYSSYNINYSRVCGRLVGYQFGSTDGAQYTGANEVACDDSITLTHGNPRKHIWSLLSGLYNSFGPSKCPCGYSLPQHTIPSFIGSDYFCEAAAVFRYNNILYTDDPLWDGKKCGNSEKNCCSSSMSLPWFNKTLDYNSSEDIELRLCCDDGTADEDIPFSLVEIYVK